MKVRTAGSGNSTIQGFEPKYLKLLYDLFNTYISAGARLTLNHPHIEHLLSL